MTVKEYIENLLAVTKENPALLAAEAIYACDDEGNAHHKVHFTPTPGKYEDGEFDDNPVDKKYNALCIN